MIWRVSRIVTNEDIAYPLAVFEPIARKKGIVMRIIYTQRFFEILLWFSNLEWVTFPDFRRT